MFHWKIYREPHYCQMSFLNSEFNQWTKFWGDPSEQAEASHEVGMNLRHFYEYASQDDATQPPFDAEALDSSLNTYKKEWSRGSDNWGSPELLALPKPAKDAVCQSLEQQKVVLCIPIQNMLNLHPLLGKLKGRRTICKTPMTYRAMCRHNESIDAWDISHLYPHDTAQKGSSALLADLKRNIDAEVAIALGLASGGFFFDYEKFFDHIDIPILLAECVQLQVPPRDIYI